MDIWTDPITGLVITNPITSRAKAVRAKCMDCSYGQYTEVRNCQCITCPLYPFRMGGNPFYGGTSQGPGNDNDPNSA